MTDPIITPPPTESPAPSPTQAAEAATKNPSTQAAAVQASGTIHSLNNMGELKAASPELYKAMMQGLATTICNEMQDHQKKLKEMMQKAREDSQA